MVLPTARYRQWTITFPWPIRYLMAKDHKRITAILGIAMRILASWQRRVAKKAGFPGAKTAAVAFVQRFGSAINLNLHLHILMPDAVFVNDSDKDTFELVELPPPTDEQVLHLTKRVAKRTLAFLQKQGDAIEDGVTDVLDETMGEAMAKLPRLPLADEPSDADPPKDTRSRRCAHIDGFSIHANTAVPADNRLGLEKLCRYGMRPAFSHERLRLTQDGNVLYTLRKPWPTPEGVSALCFEPVEFLRRLAPLIPPPFAHTIRYFGLFAPNAKHRDLLPAAPVAQLDIRPEARARTGGVGPGQAVQDGHSPQTSDKKPPQSIEGPRQNGSTKTRAQNNGAPSATAPSQSATSQGRRLIVSRPDAANDPSRAEVQAEHVSGGNRPTRKPLPWSELLRRVFAVDALVCPRCAGPMTVLAYLTDPDVLCKILLHLGLPTTPPPLGPARYPEQLDLFAEDEGYELNSEPHSRQFGDHSGPGPPTDTSGDWS